MNKKLVEQERKFAIHLAKTIESIRDDFQNQTCTSCHYYQDEVCVNDESPLCADFPPKDFGCNKWETLR